jgi:hypothetical protein
MEKSVLANILKLAAVFAAIGTAVLGATMFTTSPGNPVAAQAVMIAGLVIFGFTFVVAFGGIIAGVAQWVGQWRETHANPHHRRPVAPA